MAIRDNVIKTVRALVEAEGSKAGFARRVGATKQAVNNWVKGENAPDIEMIACIGEAYGIPLSEILGEKVEYALVSLNTDEDGCIAASHDEQTSAAALDGNESILRLREAFEKLNEEGQKKVIEYASDLESSGRYMKSKTHERVQNAGVSGVA